MKALLSKIKEYYDLGYSTFCDLGSARSLHFLQIFKETGDRHDGLSDVVTVIEMNLCSGADCLPAESKSPSGSSQESSHH